MSATTVFRPAFACALAYYTLRWDESRLAWVLCWGAAVVDVLPGFPVGGPQVTASAAQAWADDVVGPKTWINRPARSDAFHTHLGGGGCR